MAKSKFLEIGQIVSTHGVMGEVRVKPWCDSLDELTEFSTLYFDNGAKALNILSSKVHKNIVIMKIEGIDTMEAAQKLRNRVLYVDRDEYILPEGTYFIADLLGMDIVDDKSGRVYGKLNDVLQYGASDVYEIKDENGKMIMLPAIPDVVVKTDFDLNQIRVNMLEGLLDDED